MENAVEIFPKALFLFLSLKPEGGGGNERARDTIYPTIALGKQVNPEKENESTIIESVHTVCLIRKY